MSRARFRVSQFFILLVLTLTAWFARGVWLPWVGYALIHDDGPARADVALVLAGDPFGKRITTASELVRAGFVSKVMVSGPPYYDLHESESEIGYAYHHGYPLEWFVALPNNANSTREEARDIVPELRRRGIRTFLLVTSNFHTGRAGRIFRSVVRASGPGLEMRVVAAPDRFFDPKSWWRNRDAQQIVFVEWCKTIATALGR